MNGEQPEKNVAFREGGPLEGNQGPGADENPLESHLDRISLTDQPGPDSVQVAASGLTLVQDQGEEPGASSLSAIDQPMSPRIRLADLSLEDLILETGRGDRDAFAVLFERVTPRVKGYLMRMGAGASQAEEITQDVMVAVWRRARTYAVERAAATTWIYQIARNRRIDLWRREHRLVLDPHEPLLQGDQPEQPYELLDAAEEAGKVRSAIAQLPDELSHLLRLAYYDGLTHKEIARITGLPLGTAKSRIRKATNIVRNTLDPETR
jgi:RNA polymerase sigma-70 factor (ECF subfamily)